MFILGVLNGYMAILLITGLQRSIPKEMLGRMMSMVMLASMSLIPLSQVIAGAVLRWNALALFIGAGGMLLALAVYLGATRASNVLSEQLAVEKN
jgi:hypothetical protein